MTGTQKSKKASNIKKQAKRVHETDMELRKKRKIAKTNTAKELVKSSGHRTMEEEEVSAAYDTENDKLISKRDLRFNFSNIINQQPFFSHPSHPTIDLHSEMKLQRQRRLVELDMLREKELDDTKENDETGSDDDLLSFPSSEDEDFMDAKLPKLHELTTLGGNYDSWSSKLESLTTGLEQVDRLIRQLNDHDAEADILGVHEQSVLKPFECESDVKHKEQNISKTLCVTENSTKQSNCQLISETSTFRSLLNENQIAMWLPERKDQSQTLEPYESSDVSFDEFLNLGEDSATSDTDIERMTSSSSNTTIDQSGTLSRIRNFEYRYSHDKINLALVDNLSCQADIRRKNKKGPLNKSALFYGNHCEMIINDSLFQLNDFVI
ncbi:hypothetical protein KL918_005356 [Ogataea parapolymorpha]|uniref:Uncharacterized protein n=1 Tax=Ogataea parapolymorpha (strain ATCC 26012 / BCRC 20466 / JCM 22074 / NRRL Y-7560 / DL-1) TaxID=871575 RepID=W1QD29_OGAPD|nr:hypothetical protein HPODL_03268 [Ogataea parapolymorpha DL-1]ESW99378.1 hypothetical protein HPODL_03268 [Ogataea parapolymorpha DL-1]KAG7864618.1 hypothetical protein KL918_005356 [Ogataea parapolymorpha]KAG7868513.1 hypothetical protein KL916_005289 [Ogataea parapolymorpha]